MCLWKSLVADVNADRAQVLGCSRSWMLKRHSQLDQWCVCILFSLCDVSSYSVLFLKCENVVCRWSSWRPVVGLTMCVRAIWRWNITMATGTMKNSFRYQSKIIKTLFTLSFSSFLKLDLKCSSWDAFATLFPAPSCERCAHFIKRAHDLCVFEGRMMCRCSHSVTRRKSP